MSNLPYPDDFEYDYHADLQWQRQQAALKAIAPGDVLSLVDEAIASEADPATHPLFSLTCALLGCGNMPGTADGLWDRYKRLIDHAIERLVEAKLADPTAWED
jgi:hypothetical protein